MGVRFTPKDWKDYDPETQIGDPSTPVIASSLVDLEARVTDYTDQEVSTLPLVPSGGMTGQRLAKVSDEDGATQWVAPSVPPGGLAGQVLAKLSNEDGDVGWITLPDAAAPTGPVLDSITPTTSQWSTTVSLVATGSGFMAGDVLVFNGHDQATVVDSPTQVTAAAVELNTPNGISNIEWSYPAIVRRGPDGGAESEPQMFLVTGY